MKNKIYALKKQELSLVAGGSSWLVATTWLIAAAAGIAVLVLRKKLAKEYGDKLFHQAL